MTEVYIVRNDSGGPIELTSFGLVIPDTVSVDLENYDKALLDLQVISLIGTADLVRTIHGIDQPIPNARKLDGDHVNPLLAIDLLNTPPGAPTDGDVYLIDTTPTGAWVGHANEIAIADSSEGSGWRFLDCVIGQMYLVTTTNKEYFCNSSHNWEMVGDGAGQTDTVGGSNGITNTGDDVDAVLTPTYGSGTDTICEGDDTRLSDARTPADHGNEVHTPDFATISDFLTWLDRQYVESESEQVNGTTSYVLKTGASLSWTPPIAGTYHIEYTFERTTTNSSEAIQSIVELDNGGTPEAGTELNYDSHEPENSNDYQLCAGFIDEVLTQAAHRVDISFRSTDSFCNAKIRRCRITARRVA